MLLSSELNLLKSSDTNAKRGNSLFAEVEDNRQKMAAEREIIKTKYLKLKNVLSQRLAENNKLKVSTVSKFIVAYLLCCFVQFSLST